MHARLSNAIERLEHHGLGRLLAPLPFGLLAPTRATQRVQRALPALRQLRQLEGRLTLDGPGTGHQAPRARELEPGGLDLDLVLDVLTSSAASSRMLEVRGPLVARGEFPPQMKLDLFLKDLRLIREAAEAAGARIPLTEAATRLYAVARDAGHGGEDLAVVARVLAGDR